jgi:hypothetical protein
MPKKQRDNLEGSRRLESKIKRKYGKTTKQGTCGVNIGRS